MYALRLPITLLLSYCLCCSSLLGQHNYDGKWSYLYLSTSISPRNTVHDITQDEQGFIWVATEAGLAKYDGVKFRFFQPLESDLGIPCQSGITKIFPVQREVLWLSTHCGLLLFDLRTQRFYRDSILAASLPSGTVEDVLIDEHDTAWISVRTKGLFRYSLTENTLDTFAFDRRLWKRDLHFQANLTMIKSMSQGWYAISDTYFGITFLYDAATDSVHFNQNLVSVIGPAFGLQAINADQFWSVSGWGEDGVSWVDRSTGTIHNYRKKGHRVVNMNQSYTEGNWPAYDPSGPTISSDRVYCLLHTTDGSTYFGTDRGINRFVPVTHSFVQIPHQSSHRQSSAGNLIQSLFEDRDGNIWAGTQGGIRVKWKYRKPFEYQEIKLPDGAYGSQPARVNRIIEYDQEHLLLQTQYHLYLLNRQDRTVQNLRDVAPEFAFLKDYPIEFVHRQENGTLWFGTGFNRDSRGNYFLFQYDPDQGRVLHTYDYWSLPRRFSKYQATAFAERVPDEIWIGARGGLNRLDETNDTIYRYLPDAEVAGSISHAHISCLYVDQQQTLWIGTQGGGLNRYVPSTKRFIAYRNAPSDSSSLSNDIVHAIQEDSQGHLWIATAHGINRLDAKRGQFERFYNPDSPQDQVMRSMTPDEQGNFWITQNERLTKFDPIQGSFISYNAWDGLGTTILFRGFSEDNGWMYIGGETGFLAFQPQAISVTNPLLPQVRLTELQLGNQLVSPGSPDGILHQEISRINQLQLQYWQNDLTLKFAALDYTNPAQNQYAIQLEGLDTDWHSIGNKTTATFTNLPPGKYTFKVKASNNDGHWNEVPTTLQIQIFAPWYWSTWSKLAYAVLLLAGIYGLYRFQLGRRLAQAEARRLKELDAVKSRLYTNITHEFRTPLTIILGMADQVITHPKDWFLEGIRMIKRNGNRLLHLVNQLLDLAKLESGSMPLHLVQADIIPFLRYITESFRSFAEIKGIQIHFLAPTEPCIMDFDPAKTLDILSNLISNAIKYTREGGHVYVQTWKSNQNSAEQLEIKVRDTGVGMDAEEVERVFDRFYQGDTSTTRKVEGTGIGLALTQELVKLLKGSIVVESSKEQGTAFTVRLPVNQTAAALTTPEALYADYTVRPFGEQAVFSDTSEMAPEKSHLPVLLIVEDNQEIIQYLISCLHKRYQIVTANNGEIGIEKAIEIIPDIIISDVMMPEKDGYELCNTLKNDRRTSHIPIILLTAKVDVESKLQGLEVGADAYLAKPFNERELNIRLNQLVELRQRLQGQLKSSDLSSDQTYPAEDAFLQEVRSVVEIHLSDTTFGIPHLCRALHLSRSQLYRKIKALTDKSIALYIRSIRLEKAKALLRDTDKPISEIAYEVGFSNPSYFTRAFLEEIGTTPSSFRDR